MSKGVAAGEVSMSCKLVLECADGVLHVKRLQEAVAACHACSQECSRRAETEQDAASG